MPSSIVSLLQEFDDVFPKEVANGLPPIRRIEHQIYVVPGATIPNRPAYQSNPKETKEFVIHTNHESLKHLKGQRKLNKGLHKLVFEPGDWIWLRMRKERFYAQRRSKLLPRGDGDDLRTNHFQEEGNDENHQGDKYKMSKDPLHINGGPITRARAKKMQEALNGLIQDIWASSATSKGIHEDLGLERNQRLVNIIQVREQ